MKQIDWDVVYWWVRHGIWQKIAAFPDEVKWFIQRGRRGWSDRDCWSLDYYLSSWMPAALKHLKEHKQGTPIEFFDPAEDNGFNGGIQDDERGCSIANDRWDRVLDDIIFTFSAANKIQNMDWRYYPSEKYNEYATKYYEHDKMMEEKHDIYLMTKSECERFEIGFQLFVKYFFDLWD